MTKKNQGWTLIEIIVVIAIIAIIATAVLVALNPAKRMGQAQDAQRWAEVKSILTAVGSHVTDEGRSPMCTNLGINLPKDDIWRCIGPGIEEIPDPIPDPGDADVKICKIMPSCGSGQVCKKPGDLGADEECCCTSLASWNINRARDLTGGEIEVAEIDGEWTNPENNEVQITGWTTDADHYIKIYTTLQARHDGKWNKEKYRLEYSDESTSMRPLVVDENYTEIEGLQIGISGDTSSVSYSSGIDIIKGEGTKISHCIIKSTATGNETHYGIHYNNGSDKEAYFWNNIIYGFKGDGDNGRGIKVNGSPNIYILNNTVYDCPLAYNVASDTVIKNCIAQNSKCLEQGGSGGFAGIWTSDSDNNVSDCDDLGNDAPNATFAEGLADVTFINETLGNEDFHLNSADTGAKDLGMDLSDYFTDDIDGGIRGFLNNGLWDIGADEYGPVGCCDLEEALVGNGYLQSIPEDPTEGDLENLGNSGYYIKRSQTGFWVMAPHKSDYADEDKDIIVAQ